MSHANPLAVSLVDIKSRLIQQQWVVCLLNLIRGGWIQCNGRGNQFHIRGVRMVRTKILVKGHNNQVLIGSGSRLFDSVIMIHGDSHCIKIGRDCILGELTLTVLSRSNHVSIGSNCTSASVRILVLEPKTTISIGNDCMISHNVEILCSDSHSIVDVETGCRLNQAKDIYIADHVWLGANCAVLKGSSIGKDSVIGFRSIVTGHLPSSSICVGTPASVLKTGITWNRDLL